MYCPECGTKIENGSRFCPECGTKVDQIVPENTMTTPSHEEESKDDSSLMASVIIFTNVSLLAKQMNVKTTDIYELFEKFIEIKAEYGIRYKLVDVGDYKYHKKGFLGTSKKVSLNADSEIWDYMDILMDTHKYESNHDRLVSQYLFIIGGDDIIPMPCVKHYIPNDKHDDTIDSDILYAYPYGSDMLPLLENQEIFKHDQLFFIGRLPFGVDASYDDLYNYLQRDIDNSTGICMNEAYGQCDPNWKNISVKTSQEFSPHMRNFEGRLSPEHYYLKMILSPMVDDSNVNQILHPDASLYYFNLHGSNAVKVRGYAGAPCGENRTRMVIQPEHLTIPRRPNIVVSEACYGGRFIGLDKHHSMLLSAIHTQTMNFVGSSRVAWGGVDSPQTTPTNPSLRNADLIANVFTRSMLQGYTAGQSLFMARSAVLEKQADGDLLAALSVVEFNLYGDPIMFMTKPSVENKVLHKHIETKPFVASDADVQSSISEISFEKDNASSSILDRVRGLVDDNIAQIHTSIGKHLYEQFGLEPRPAETILKIKHGNGREEYNYTYKASESDSEIPLFYSVTVSSDGKIENVYSSK